MNSMTIYDLDETLGKELHSQANKHGCSIEEEVRDILKLVLSNAAAAKAPSFVDSIRALIAPIGGVFLEIAPREPMQNATDFTQ